MTQRSNNGFLQPLEQPALFWMARRLPGWLTPDLLTGVGFIGACITAASYGLSSRHPGFLWLATAGLLINWFGDSLDGTVARVRRIERPRYGFFLDQSLDAFGQLLIAIGIGFSGLVRFEFAISTLAIYYLMSIMTLVRTVVSNVFNLTYAGIGSTELRVMFSILNAIMFFLPPRPFTVFGLSIVYPEILTSVWTVAMLISFFIIFRSDLVKLAIEDSPPRNN